MRNILRQLPELLLRTISMRTGSRRSRGSVWLIPAMFEDSILRPPPLVRNSSTSEDKYGFRKNNSGPFMIEVFRIRHREVIRMLKTEGYDPQIIHRQNGKYYYRIEII